MYYTYVLKRKNGQFYIGSTIDLRRRFAEHTRKYPCELVYYEAYQKRDSALTRERKLKQYGSAWSGLKQRI